MLFTFKQVLALPLNDMQDTIRAKRGKRLPTVLSPDEVRRLLAAIPSPHRTAIELLYGTGLRLTELCQLRVKDLDFANHVLHRRAIVFLVSDFALPDTDQSLTEVRRAVRLVNRRHDVVALQVQDRHETELPDVGQLALEDAETGELIELDTTDARIRARFAELAQARKQIVRHALASEGVDYLHLDTREPYEPALRSFFKNRQRRQQ